MMSPSVDSFQFVTTVGDMRDGGGSSFTAGAAFKHNIRALQRAFTQTTTSPSMTPRSGARTPASSASGSSSRRNSSSARNTPSPTFPSVIQPESPGMLEIPSTVKASKAKKVKKRLGYLFVSPAAVVDAEGEDVRHTLGEVARLAQSGVLRPSILAGWLPPGARHRQSSLFMDDTGVGLPRAVVNGPKVGAFKIVPFERTPDALRFGFGNEGPPVDLDNGGIAVVRVMD